MNNSETAKNGFKTFVITLFISLIVFGGLYYIISGPANKVDIEKNLQSTGSTIASANTSKNVFEDLSKQKIKDIPQKMVLAGATGQTTQSTVPQTGTTEMTTGFFLSLMILLVSVYVIFKGPRKYALSSFEKDVLRDLE